MDIMSFRIGEIYSETVMNTGLITGSQLYDIIHNYRLTQPRLYGVTGSLGWHDGAVSGFVFSPALDGRQFFPDGYALVYFNPVPQERPGSHRARLLDGQWWSPAFRMEEQYMGLAIQDVRFPPPENIGQLRPRDQMPPYEANQVISRGRKLAEDLRRAIPAHLERVAESLVQSIRDEIDTALARPTDTANEVVVEDGSPSAMSA